MAVIDTLLRAPQRMLADGRARKAERQEKDQRELDKMKEMVGYFADADQFPNGVFLIAYRHTVPLGVDGYPRYKLAEDGNLKTTLQIARPQDKELGALTLEGQEYTDWGEARTRHSSGRFLDFSEPATIETTFYIGPGSQNRVVKRPVGWSGPNSHFSFFDSDNRAQSPSIQQLFATAVRAQYIRSKFLKQPAFMRPDQDGERREHSLAVNDKTIGISDDLLNPHFTDTRFNVFGGVTIFLAQGYDTNITEDIIEGATYDHDDRLKNRFPPTKIENAKNLAQSVVGNTNSARYFEEYLRALFDNPQLQLIHIKTGVNKSHGGPYKSFGYIFPPKEEQVA